MARSMCDVPESFFLVRGPASTCCLGTLRPALYSLLRCLLSARQVKFAGLWILSSTAFNVTYLLAAGGHRYANSLFSIPPPSLVPIALVMDMQVPSPPGPCFYVVPLDCLSTYGADIDRRFIVLFHLPLPPACSAFLNISFTLAQSFRLASATSAYRTL